MKKFLFLICIAAIVSACDAETQKNAWVKVNGSPVTPVDGVYSINAKTVVIGKEGFKHTRE